MFIKIKTLLYLALITRIMTSTFSCNNTPPATENVTEVKTPVTVVPVTFKKVTSTVDLPAVSTFMNKSIIRATTTGAIEKISVVQGDFVTINQMLFTIRTREAKALQNRERNDSSLAFKGLINISSLKEGVISSVSHQNGDFVQEGDELAVISEQSSLVFILDVPFELDRFVHKNIKCSVLLPDNTRINGTITGKLPEMNVETQTIRYIIRPSSAGRLPGNLIASVGLVRTSNDNALVLPKKAVLGDETQTEFWVMKLLNDSVAVKVNISKGFEDNTEVEITRPLFLHSDKIVLTGNYGLQDTAKISIIKE